jgi:hypothetical protein
MKIRINKYGHLEIERAGKFKSQHCPFIADITKYDSVCGDWCPLFKEPIIYNSISIYLKICCENSFTLSKEDFIDERGKND